ncbi:hypothetical protein V5E97_25685 [Singulisphaera sp. Ch08]|uniref:Cytochrome c domain-containing protein n=1 Tax=Singulisphaera sp. Ch08 TaxID=3120278 RepID=A0AAU7CUK2_9BACT
MLDSRDGRAIWRFCLPRRLVLVAWMAWFGSPLAMGEGPLSASAGGKKPPTYTKDVAPIIQKKCQNCHRRHQVGPFALETYEQARKRAADIASVVSDRLMPPWKPARGVGPTLKHDQSLSHEEIATLEAWAAAGAPQGDPKHLPPPAQFAEGWKLGPPDLILEPAEDFKIRASCPDTYRCFVLPTNLAKDTYISAIDFRPGNTKVVHHINAFLDSSGEGRSKDKAEPRPGYTSFAGPGIAVYEDLSFWAGGHEPSHFPPGVGQLLPRQSDVILQVHYHATGKSEVDRTRVGIYFSRGPVKQALHWTTVSNSKFQLPVGAANFEVKANWYVPIELEILAVSPHMHLLGRDMRMSVTLPNGTKQDLIHIPVWDPSWQSAYFFQKPITLPGGAVVNVTAHFDNSDHSRNPNQPPKRVAWGYGADDEMCEGFIAVVKKGQDLTLPWVKDDLAEILSKQRLKNMLKQTARQAR